MLFILSEFKSFERGQGLVEYALLIALIALVVTLAMVLMGPSIGEAFSEVGSAMQ